MKKFLPSLILSFLVLLSLSACLSDSDEGLIGGDGVDVPEQESELDAGAGDGDMLGDEDGDSFEHESELEPENSDDDTEAGFEVEPDSEPEAEADVVSELDMESDILDQEWNCAEEDSDSEWEGYIPSGLQLSPDYIEALVEEDSSHVVRPTYKLTNYTGRDIDILRVVVLENSDDIVDFAQMPDFPATIPDNGTLEFEVGIRRSGALRTMPGCRGAPHA